MSGLNPTHPLLDLVQTRPDGPFDPRDPVALDELTEAQRVWRVVFHLLVTGPGHIDLPEYRIPSVLDLVVAAGFLYHVDVTTVDDDEDLRRVEVKYIGDVVKGVKT